MVKIHQVIVRNIPERGLSVVSSTLHKSQILDISLFLPEDKPHEFNGVFLTKFQHLSGDIVLCFTFDDGIDQFGRGTIKTHTLIIESSFYNERTAQYFISPLINGSMNREENTVLKPNDFEVLDTYTVFSKFVEQVFCKKHVQLTSQNETDVLELIQIFGAIDRAIPPPLNPFFSFQTKFLPVIALRNVLLFFHLGKYPIRNRSNKFNEKNLNFLPFKQ